MGSPGTRSIQARGHRWHVVAVAAGVILALGLASFAAEAQGPHNKATGSVDWSPQAGPNVGVVFESSFDVHEDAPAARQTTEDRGTVVTTNTATEVTRSFTINCVIVEDNEAWFSGTRDFDGAQASFYVRDDAQPGGVFAQFTNPGAANYPCTHQWSAETDYLSGNVTVHFSE